MYGKFYESYKQFVEEIQTRKLVFFCAGWRCLEVIHQYYRFPYEEIAFICDNMPEKWGGSVYNVPVCSPDKLLENPERYVVLIAVTDNFALKRIMQQLEEMGVPHYYSAAILNFENMSNVHLCTSTALHDEIIRRANEIDGKVYLFFDEIQEVTS